MVFNALSFTRPLRNLEAFQKAGLVKNFEELLNNIFQPLFEVALDPAPCPDSLRFRLEMASKQLFRRGGTA